MEGGEPDRVGRDDGKVGGTCILPRAHVNILGEILAAQAHGLAKTAALGDSKVKSHTSHAV